VAVTKRDMEIAALNWKVRAETLERKVEEHVHALNLLVNDSVYWFVEFPSSDGSTHAFGIGIAKGVPTNRSGFGVSLPDHEDVPIVFWRTAFMKGGKFMSIFGLTEFKDPNLEVGSAELSDLVKRAAALVDPAISHYMSRMKKKPRVN